jgi:RsiW-degrading membrane proteinase PrsW (M82 family)
MIEMLIVAVAPSAALLLFIYQKDRYDREPPSLLFKLFIFGCFSVIPAYFIERFLSFFIGGFVVLQAFIVAGLTEESVKYFIVRKASYKSRFYDEKLDGIIYCVFVSLGFATIENILYLIKANIGFMYTGVTRAIFAVPAHMLFAITMGYYLSLAKFSNNKATEESFMVKALLVPVVLHGIYDYILMSRLYSIFPIFLLFVVFLWRFNLKKLNRYVNESRIGNRDN